MRKIILVFALCICGIASAHAQTSGLNPPPPPVCSASNAGALYTQTSTSPNTVWTCSYYNLQYQWVVNPMYGGLVYYPIVPTTCSGALPVFLAGYPTTTMYVCIQGVPTAVAGGGAGNITSLTGDATATGPGAAATTVTGINGAAIGASINVLATNASKQVVGATYQNVVNLFGSGSCSGYLKSDGTCSTPSSIPTGTTNQLLYYAAGGNTVTPLTLGTNLSITGGTLNATGGIASVNSQTGPALTVQSALNTITISEPSTNVIDFESRFVAPPIYLNSLVGAFVDASGNVIEPIYIGDGPVTFLVPPGSVDLQLGDNDDVYVDEGGSWTVSVDGTNYTVLGTAAPWLNIGTNVTKYPTGPSGNTAPTSLAVTAGNLVTISYVSGLVTTHEKPAGVDANGNTSSLGTGTGESGNYFPGHWALTSPLTGTNTIVNVNGSSVSSPNFNGTTPAPPANSANIAFQSSGSSVSGNLAITGTAPITVTPGTNSFTVACPTCGTATGGTAVSINSGAALGSLGLVGNLPVLCADSSGSGTAQSCTTSPTFTPQNGNCWVYETTTANTGTALTLAVNGGTATSVAVPSGSGWTTTLTAGAIPANKPLQVCDDGTNYNVQATGTAGSASGSASTPFQPTPTSTGLTSITIYDANYLVPQVIYQNTTGKSLYLIWDPYSGLSPSTGSISVGTTSTNLTETYSGALGVYNTISSGVMRAFVPAGDYYSLSTQTSTAGFEGPVQSLLIQQIPSLTDSGDLAGTSRALATVYQNTTGEPLFVQAVVTGQTGTNQPTECISDATSSPTTLVAYQDALGGSTGGASVTCLVPNNNYYKITGTGTLAHWHEYSFSASILQSANLTGSRALGTVYQNTTGHDIWLSTGYTMGTGNSVAYVGPSSSVLYNIRQDSDHGSQIGDWFFVPSNWYYEITENTGGTLAYWYEYQVY